MKRSRVSHHNDTPRRRLNGHAGANGSVPSPGGAAAPSGLTELGKAGSDDAREFSAANAASLSTAGADRTATADLAESAAEGRLRAAGTASGACAARQPDGVFASQQIPRAKGDEETGAGAKGKKENPFAAVPPGRKPLPRNGEAFVKAVHRRIDLLELEVKLLRHEDEKVVQRELAYLRELRYGKRAPAETENDSTRSIIYDAPRPPRDLP